MDSESSAESIVADIEEMFRDPFMRMMAGEATLASRQTITNLVTNIVAIRDAFGEAARSIPEDELAVYCFAAIVRRYANTEDAEAVISGSLAVAIIMLMEKEEQIRALMSTTN